MFTVIAMKPINDTHDADDDDVKDFLSRWSQDPSFREYELHVQLWCALEGEGFSDIRLRRESYERPHRIWRFTMNRGERHRTSLAVESAVRKACETLCRTVKKDFVAATICGSRARGMFILPIQPEATTMGRFKSQAVCER